MAHSKAHGHKVFAAVPKSSTGTVRKFALRERRPD